MTQIDHHARRSFTAASLPLAAAREAYVRGDFPAVLDLLSEVRVGGVAPIEARLLRARALLKLLRPGEVVAELADVLATIADTDERITARMLHAAALARLSPERGAALLADVATAAQRDHAHPSVRAEVAYFRAVAHWSVRELTLAERFAREAQRTGRDVLSVRATQLRAFIAAASDRPSRYLDALALFRSAARAYGRCRERDVDLATIIVGQIAALEQTLRSAHVPGTHRAVRGGRALPGCAFAPATASPALLRLCYEDAWLFALDGDAVGALRKMREAEASAPTPAWRAFALAAASAIALVFGEAAAARTSADAATELAKSVAWNETTDDERKAFVHLAEVYANLGDAAAAANALAQYDGITRPMDRTRLQRDRDGDPRLGGWYAHVVGLVRRGSGDHRGAVEAFRSAVEAFRSCGFRWREALALIELDATSTAGDHRAELDRAVAMIAEDFPRSFLANRLGPWLRVAVDPELRALTPAQRDVLRHLLDGRTTAEIGQLTGRAHTTVKKHLLALHRAFNTQTGHQLVVACAKRGIGAPSWCFPAAPLSAWRRARSTE